MLDGKSWLMLLHVFGALIAALWILRGLLPCAGPFAVLRKSPTARCGEDSSDCPSGSACGARLACYCHTSLLDQRPLAYCGPW